MAAQHALRKLDELEEEQDNSGYTGTSRWMIPYADLMTLLLGFFIVMFAFMADRSDQLYEQSQQINLALVQEQARVEQANEEVMALNVALEEMRAEEIYGEPDMAIEEPQGSSQSIADVEVNLLQELGLDDQQVTLTQDDRGLVISFQDRIFFAPGRANLSSEAKDTMDRLANVLKKADRAVRVEGHTDNTPISTARFPSNWELSTARATTILKYLVDSHDFDPTRLSAAGFGEFHPIDDNSSIEGKRKNRRVDIVLLNPLPVNSH